MRKWINLIEDAAYNLITEAQEAPPTPYGYWIKSDGEFIIVENQAHQSTLVGMGMEGYDAAYKLGWIRVVAYYPGRSGEQPIAGTKELSASFAPAFAAIRAMSSLRKLASDPIFISYGCDVKKEMGYGFGSYGFGSYCGDLFEDLAPFIQWMNIKIRDAKEAARAQEPAMAESIIESFASTEKLYHGLDIDSLWLVMKSGKLSTEPKGWGHEGPEGICLTRSWRVAVSHSGSQMENLNDSFFSYFNLGTAPELSFCVLEFDRSKIANEIIPYDDFAGWGDNSGEGQEEEERVIGDLSLDALTAIHVKGEDLKTFLDYALRAHRNGGKEYTEEFQTIIRDLMNDPRLRTF